MQCLWWNNDAIGNQENFFVYFDRLVQYEALVESLVQDNLVHMYSIFFRVTLAVTERLRGKRIKFYQVQQKVSLNWISQSHAILECY